MLYLGDKTGERADIAVDESDREALAAAIADNYWPRLQVFNLTRMYVAPAQLAGYTCVSSMPGGEVWKCDNPPAWPLFIFKRRWQTVAELPFAIVHGHE